MEDLMSGAARTPAKGDLVMLEGEEDEFVLWVVGERVERPDYPPMVILRGREDDHDRATLIRDVPAPTLKNWRWDDGGWWVASHLPR
jgi:hypothetical protein